MVSTYVATWDNENNSWCVEEFRTREVVESNLTRTEAAQTAMMLNNSVNNVQNS